MLAAWPVCRLLLTHCLRALQALDLAFLNGRIDLYLGLELGPAWLVADEHSL